mmetsp:Transcript_18616/g.29664  ORF Transcript_18616/g.29664 Transcript_18616/m.29664 type:complete len:430 (-) Transcript_18616:238-1527(-)
MTSSMSEWMESKDLSKNTYELYKGNVREAAIPKLISVKDAKMPAEDDEDATLLAENIPFEDLNIDKVIGEGAFGSVYIGNLYGQPVAIKRFKPRDDNTKEDIMNEVRVMRTLRHPNVVEYLGVSIHNHGIAIVSEFMEGGTLDAVLRNKKKEGKKLRIKRCVKYLRDIARGLSWLHHRGIIHRDLKPTNILLDEDQRKCKIADFGLAHVKTSKKTSGHYGMVGTMCYAAPEVLEKRKYGLSADIFSFGMIAVETIEGEYPLSLEMIPTNDFTTAIVEGVRPKIPARAPKKLQEMLKMCWVTKQTLRPSAIQLLTLLGSIYVEIERKSMLEPTEDLEDLLEDLPLKARKAFQIQQETIAILTNKLKEEKEKYIKAVSEARTMEAELLVLRGMGATISKSSGLPSMVVESIPKPIKMAVIDLNKSLKQNRV